MPLSPARGGRGGPPLRLQVVLVLAAVLVLVIFTLSSVKLPRHTLLLEEEFEDLVVSHLSRHPHVNLCDCETGVGPGGAPRFCRLGLPPNRTFDGGDGGDAAAGAGGDAGAQEEQHGEQQGDEGAAAGQQMAGGQEQQAADGGAATQQQQGQQQQQQQQQQAVQQAVQHRLAVLIPYRDREAHLAALLRGLRPFLDRQGRAHDVFVIEQADGYLFNRGALLNAAAQLLQGSAYDYFVFQDVDTIPLEKGNIQYSFPRGLAPLHLTPNWIHPKSNFEDFFGGLLIITAEQFRRLNGFGTQFWGWGREDDNLRERLLRAGMWPPEYPRVPRGTSSKRAYFMHQKHKQAEELRAAENAQGEVQYFQENPRIPYRGAKIMSSQPQFLQDFATGLNTTMFRVLSIQPFLNATKLSLALHCNTTATPWCKPEAIVARHLPSIRHAAAVHAVVGS